MLTVGTLNGTLHAQFGAGLGPPAEAPAGGRAPGGEQLDGAAAPGGLGGPGGLAPGGSGAPGMAPGGTVNAGGGPGMAMGMMGGGGMEGGMPGGMGGGGFGGGGMGGFGGGGFAGGMMGMAPGMGSMSSYNGPLVVWAKPQGEKPQWLVTGNNAIQANEALRRNLETANTCEFQEIPLQVAVAELLDKAKVPYAINNQDLESAGHSPDIAISLSGKGPTRELLRRLLAPLDLGYIVREDYIEITSMDTVDNDPVLRTYDLAHVMPNNQGLTELLLCIQTTIEPNVWTNNGGDAAISQLGSLLVIRAPENVQHEISKLLVIRSQQPQAIGQEGVGGLSTHGSQLSPNSDSTFGSEAAPLGGKALAPDSVPAGGLAPSTSGSSDQ